MLTINNLILAASIASLSAASLATEPAAPASAPRFTFSWQLEPGDPLTPRGGTTRGAPVTLDEQPSAAWRALREPGLSALERDRRAILAMAGDYRVTFDFLEISVFDQKKGRDRPYQSWGTERIYVDSDTGRTISLVHIIEMHVLGQDGSSTEPIVTKHWRQTWQYEPRDLVEYRGRDRWERRKLKTTERSHQWSQTVYQVDESPRYASVGRWDHTGSFSSWISGDTWRPLPRREWTVRSDYQALIGTNRHTITPTGWIQEENNLKAVLTRDGSVDTSGPYLAREYGVARYSRIRGADFAAADQYYSRTRQFWNSVVAAWTLIFAEHPQVSLRAPVDQAGLFRALFEYADDLESGATPSQPADQVIRKSLTEMGAPLTGG